jgi:alpha-glucosidase
LDEEHLKAVEKAVAIRQRFTLLILELARNSAKTGDPLVPPLEYEFPNQRFEDVKDEFMLGDSILVAQRDKRGTSRQWVLPKGTWIGDDGKTLNGGATYTLEVPLDRIPCFRLKR